MTGKEDFRGVGVVFARMEIGLTKREVCHESWTVLVSQRGIEILSEVSLTCRGEVTLLIKTVIPVNSFQMSKQSNFEEMYMSYCEK